MAVPSAFRRAPALTGPSAFRRPALVGLLAAAALCPLSGAPAHAEDATPAAPESLSPSVRTYGHPDGALAGHRAGQGRERPGRPEDPPAAHPADQAAPDARDARDPEAPGDVPRDPDRPAEAADPRTGAPEAPDEPAGPAESAPAADPGADAGSDTRPGIRREVADRASDDHVPTVLPLGTGLTLMGLGLGFFALRMRLRRDGPSAPRRRAPRR
ncbi:hypothetical protein [Streptomyces sp. URMC 123]|uniref:hypothetical protein n=1 Tax=Streptomyces sp. URMC 123 TaxID=3423403 RepID=UPI003F1CC278